MKNGLFISYHGGDREAVRSIQRFLTERGIETFLDRDVLAAGLPWPQALEDALRKASAVAVFLGPSGLGRWRKRELGFALDRQAREED